MHRFVLFLAAFVFSSQALANCIDTCESDRNSCQQSSAKQQATSCDEQYSVCKLSCNRQQTMSCVYLGFKNHAGTADKEKELTAVTKDFARVTDEQSRHFDGLCKSNGMRCDFVLDWKGEMFSCGGEVREPNRVACCR